MPEGLVIGHHECAHELKLEAHERVTQVQLDNINARLNRMEELMQRLEKRLWISVYGVVAAVLAQGIQSFLAVTP